MIENPPMIAFGSGKTPSLMVPSIRHRRKSGIAASHGPFLINNFRAILPEQSSRLRNIRVGDFLA